MMYHHHWLIWLIRSLRFRSSFEPAAVSALLFHTRVVFWLYIYCLLWHHCQKIFRFYVKNPFWSQVKIVGGADSIISVTLRLGGRMVRARRVRRRRTRGARRCHSLCNSRGSLQSPQGSRQMRQRHRGEFWRNVIITSRPEVQVSCDKYMISGLCSLTTG